MNSALLSLVPGWNDFQVRECNLEQVDLASLGHDHDSYEPLIGQDSDSWCNVIQRGSAVVRTITKAQGENMVDRTLTDAMQTIKLVV